MSNRGCSTCNKCGPWRYEKFGKSTIVIADCSHVPVSPFWVRAGGVQVVPGAGTDCPHWDPVPEKVAEKEAT